MSAARKIEEEPMAFPLPEKALAMHTIALAKTRAGKSSVLRLIVEHGLDQGRPVCIIDPKGDWWGIKSSANGKQAGYPVVIFGGEHADVPINEHAGAHVAELVATGNRPALIDLGGWMPAERTRFFIAFASTFFRMTRGARWLVIDECHNFAPQGKVLDPDSGKMLHWANRLASEGAGKGVTLFSASQRPQKVHKDYVTSHDTLIALRSVHPLDRAQVKDWMAGVDPKKAIEIDGQLATLDRGEAYVWSPEAKFGPKRLQFPLFSTFDSFAAPKGDEHIAKLKGWAAVDLDDVKAKLAVVVEEAKKSDPKALKAEVARLTRELSAAQKHPAAASQPAAGLSDAEIQNIRDAAFRDGAASREGDVTDAFNAGADSVLAAADKGLEAARATIASARQKLAPPKTKAIAAPRATATAPTVGAISPKPLHRPAPVVRPAPTPSGDGISASQSRILEALAFWLSIDIERPSRAQVGAAAGYSPSSGNFGNLLGQLRAIGYVDYPAPNLVCLTDEGVAIAPAGGDAIPVRDRLAKILSNSQAKILDAMPIDGSEISREDLGAATGYSHTSGNFGNLLGQLRTLGLIEYPRTGFVAVETWVWS